MNTMGRQLPLLLLLLWWQAAGFVQSDHCDEISSSVIFNQIAISNLLRERNVCATDVEETAQTMVAKVEAAAQELKDYLTTMQNGFKEEMKTWLTSALQDHTEDMKTRLSESVQNITEGLTFDEAEGQPIPKWIESLLRLLANTSELTPTKGPETQHLDPDKVKDCLSHKLLGKNLNGSYVIYPFNCSTGVPVWCDMTTDDGGWSLMVKRKEHTPQVDFRRGWQDYKTGFGDPLTEYWLGNDAIHAMTTGASSEVRVDGEAFASDGGQRHGYWDDFYISDELDLYKLHIGDMREGDGTMGNTLERSNGDSFTTIDKDNDSRDNNCAADYGGGGWWYDSCSNAFPTGPIVHTDKWDDSLNMYKWKPDRYGYHSLRWVEIKFRNSVREIRYCDAS